MALLKRDEEPVMQRGGGELNALLGRGSTFEGKLTFEGQVRIDGRFVGQVLTRDTLVVGEGGQVQADISAGTVIIAGHVEGTIVAAQLVQLGATARVGKSQVAALCCGTRSRRACSRSRRASSRARLARIAPDAARSSASRKSARSSVG